MGYSLTKIAEELGLSKATVSLVLNGKARSGRISPEVEKRVTEFCKKVNYVPNIHAQRINRKIVKSIGFLVNRGVRVDMDNPFSDYNINGIMGGIVLEAEKSEYRVSVQLYNSGMNENRVFGWLRNREIDGLIYYGLDIPDEWKKVFVGEGHHVVGIGIEPDEHISSVNTDNFEASAALTKHLIDSGRRKFVYLSGIDGSFVSDERRRGFMSVLAENGIDILPQNIICAEYSEKRASDIVSSLPVDNVDAIVCANDDMAIGALRALKNRNISVPDTIAVAGGDNIVTGEYFSPSLTTFSNHQHELGAAAVCSVMRLIGGGSAEHVIIPADIIVREST